MATIKLSKSTGYQPIPNGKHVFKIVKVTYDEDFGKMEIELVTAAGQKHTERYNLIGNDGEYNEKAVAAFSYFAKVALNDFNLDEIDHEELEGRYIECTVDHDVQPNKNKPGSNVTFIRLADKAPAEGFAAAAKKETKKSALDDIL